MIHVGRAYIAPDGELDVIPFEVLVNRIPNELP